MQFKFEICFKRGSEQSHKSVSSKVGLISIFCQMLMESPIALKAY